MMFLDVIATPFYLMFGFAAVLIVIGIACLVGLTMVIFALFQRFSKKKDKDKNKDT